MSRGLRVPVAAVSGQNEGLPALSARASETNVVFSGETAAGSLTIVELTGGTVEIEVTNLGEDPVRIAFIVTDSVPELGVGQALLVNGKGFRRLVPGVSTLVEVRAVAEGDSIIVYTAGAVDMRIHDHLGAV